MFRRDSRFGGIRGVGKVGVPSILRCPLVERTDFFKMTKGAGAGSSSFIRCFLSFGNKFLGGGGRHGQF
jgi:hypothetical protein